tara:strand:+ start:175 stop:516 length:342 start_codon:yes stop_codon:yes gene_type:complete
MKKLIFTCIFFIGFSVAGFAQSDKIKEKANEWVNNLNTEIVSVDKSLALTELQINQITVIQVERLIELKKAKKEGADKEGNKAINKKHFQKIFKEVLTKEQMKARKTAKEKSK